MAESVTGVAKRQGKGPFILVDPARSFRAAGRPVQVPWDLANGVNLASGALVAGLVRQGRRGPELATIETIGGAPPEQYRDRISYRDLVAIDPDQRFDLAGCGDITMRVIDLLAPIGKGTRGLIVSPPKAGKTMVLEKIANAIHASDPKTRVLALLIDERPKEVTQFRRATQAEVLASCNDQSVQDHIELARMTMDHAVAELECGCDVVVLMDSLTRLGRAFNLQPQRQGRDRRGGRIMSGGMAAGALEIPRRFFGLARNVEGGGSVTIIATCLIDTGSRMDQLIFEEFKGTGNSEIVLDRRLSEARIYPAIDIASSGTRKEELLYDPEQLKRLHGIRRALIDLNPTDAMRSLLKQLEKHTTNEQFLKNLPS